VLQGEVVIDTALSGPIVAPLGSTIGVAETLAGVSSGTHARVTRSGRALRLERERLFGVLGDEVELMQGLFSGVLALGRKTVELA
jgi:hypothetical protein